METALAVETGVSFVLGVLIGAYSPRAEPIITLSAAHVVAALGFAYSREQEREADRQAVLYLARLGYPADHLRRALLHLKRVGGDSGGGFYDTHPSTSDRLAAIQDATRPDIATFWTVVGNQERETLVARSPALTPSSPEVKQIFARRRIPYYRPNGELLLLVEYPEMGTGAPLTRLIIRDGQHGIVGEMRRTGSSFEVLTPDGRRVGTMTVLQGGGNDIYNLAGDLVAKIRLRGDGAYELYALPVSLAGASPSGEPSPPQPSAEPSPDSCAELGGRWDGVGCTFTGTR